MAACSDDAPRAPAEGEPAAAATVPEGVAPPLPPPGSAPPAPSAPPLASLAPPPEPSCPPEMVKVRPKRGGAYCVDRYEAMLVDVATNTAVSPFYPPERSKALYLHKLWSDKRGGGTDLERSMELPDLPEWQRKRNFQAKAVSKKGVIPQGYATGKDAEAACKNAGKRLCTRDEWKAACRGEQDRLFPYGDEFEQGKCNIWREAHPGALLWDDPSVNHTDPRLNLVSSKKGPLLRRTGATPTCVSVWGDDGIHDMVGNLDEWIDDPEGTFLGGFYSRGKKDGCDSSVEAHPLSYGDYSTGVRCCADLP